jgi:outer membrane protein TolC
MRPPFFTACRTSLYILPVLVAVLLAVVLPASAWAEPLSLSVDEAVELALKSSLEVYGQSQAVGAALRNLENRWNLFLPGISLGAIARWSDSLLIEAAPVRTGGAAADPFSSTLSFGTSLSVTTGVLFDLEDRRNGYHSAVLSERETTAKVIREVHKAYFKLVSQKQELANKERAILLAAERLKLANFRFERGLGPELELLRARLTEQTARSGYEKALAEQQKRQAAFKRLIGIEADVDLAFSSELDFSLTAPEVDIEKLVDGRADLGKARLAVSNAETNLDRSFAAYRLPALKLDASYNVGLADFETGSDRLVLSATFSLNADAWIPNSRRDLELQLLRETQERLVRKHEQDRRNILEAVGALVQDLELAGRSLVLVEAQVKLAERIYEGTRAAYERGMATALQLETDSAAVDTARQAFVSSRYEYLVLLIDLGYELDSDWRTLFR